MKQCGSKVRNFNGSLVTAFLTAPGTQANIDKQANILGQRFCNAASSLRPKQYFRYKHTVQKQTSD